MKCSPPTLLFLPNIPPPVFPMLEDHVPPSIFGRKKAAPLGLHGSFSYSESTFFPLPDPFSLAEPLATFLSLESLLRLPCDPYVRKMDPPDRQQILPFSLHGARQDVGPESLRFSLNSFPRCQHSVFPHRQVRILSFISHPFRTPSVKTSAYSLISVFFIALFHASRSPCFF